jgi:hypothetical protein
MHPDSITWNTHLAVNVAGQPGSLAAVQLYGPASGQAGVRQMDLTKNRLSHQ